PQDLKVTLVESSDNDAYYNYYSEKVAEALNKIELRIKKSVIGTKPQLKPRLGLYGELSSSRLGVATQDLSEQLAQYFGVEGGGVLVTSVRNGGPAESAGFKAGDSIVEINGTAIVDKGDFRKELNKIKSGEA